MTRPPRHSGNDTRTGQRSALTPPRSLPPGSRQRTARKRTHLGSRENGRRALLFGDGQLRLPSRYHWWAPAGLHFGYDGARHFLGGGKHLAESAFTSCSGPATARPEARSLLSRSRRGSRTGTAAQVEIHCPGRPGMPGCDRWANDRPGLRCAGRLDALSSPAGETARNGRGRPALKSTNASDPANRTAQLTPGKVVRTATPPAACPPAAQVHACRGRPPRSTAGQSPPLPCPGAG